jgi:ubiquitin-activating enzyme E1
MQTTTSVIDEDWQSRQLATYGMPVMQRLAGASILIIGLNGLGVEVSKNIVLANVRKVTLADDRIAAWSDLGTHFYLQPDDVGKTNRALACARSLKDVNPGVEVLCWTAAISEELLAQHHAVCVCDCVCTSEEGPISFKWNEICRNRGISFVRCEARGVFGYVFDDLASSGRGVGTFSVPDAGQDVAHISNSNPAIVTIHEWKGGYLVGESVKITGVHGMPELNGVVRGQKWERLFGQRQLLVTLDVDTTSMGAYRNGGLIKVSPFEKLHKFASFKDAWFGGSTVQQLDEAMMWPLVGDLGQSDHPWGLKCEAKNEPNPHITRMLRAAFRALENHPGRKFFQGNEGEALAFVDEICSRIRQTDPRIFFCSDEYDDSNGVDHREDVIQSMRPFFTTFAMSCAGCLSPVAACVGGIAAQEIIKSVACIDDPLSQFLFCSFFDILPKPLPTFAEVAPLNTRYDSQIAVLGAPFHDELRALKVHYFTLSALHH